MKTLIQRSIGLIALLGLISVTKAQFPFPSVGHWPYYPPGPPISPCESNSVAYITITNPAYGGVWWTNKLAGIVRAEVQGFNDVRIIALRRDALKYCAPSNSIAFYSPSNQSYKFAVTAGSYPTQDVVITFQFFAVQPPPPPPPMPTFKIVEMPNSIDNGQGQVVFEITNTIPELIYQMFYSQVLLPPNDSRWIPHFGVSGQQEPPILTYQPSHMTTNRPNGFWMVRGVTFENYHADSIRLANDSLYDEIDPPIGYPPIIISTNGGGDITPPQ